MYSGGRSQERFPVRQPQQPQQPNNAASPTVSNRAALLTSSKCWTELQDESQMTQFERVLQGNKQEPSNQANGEKELSVPSGRSPQLSPRSRDRSATADSSFTSHTSTNGSDLIPSIRNRGATIGGEKPIRTILHALGDTAQDVEGEMVGEDGKTAHQKLAHLGVQFRNLKDINKSVRGSQVPNELRLSKLGIKTRKGGPTPRNPHPILAEDKRRSLTEVIRAEMNKGLNEDRYVNPSALLKQSFSASNNQRQSGYNKIVQAARERKNDRDEKGKEKQATPTTPTTLNRKSPRQADLLRQSGDKLSFKNYLKEVNNKKAPEATPPSSSSTNTASPVVNEEVEARADHLNYIWEKKMAKMMVKTRQKEADLRKLELKRFPFQLCYTSKKFLVKLDLSRNRITSLRDFEDAGRSVFSSMMLLQELNLSSNMLTEIPQDISKLSKLRVLDLSRNEISYINPNGLPKLTELEDLILAKNRLTELPEEICNLESLLGLSVQENALSSLPKNMGNLKNLLALNLSSNQFGDIPYQICECKQLQELFFSKNKISYLREGLDIQRLENLMLLDLSDNTIQDLIGSPLSNAVAKKNLTDQFMCLKELVVLSLQGNQLHTLPSQMWQLKSLKVLTLLPGNDELVRSNSVPLDVIDRGTKAILSHLKKKGREPAPKLKPAKLNESQDITQFLRTVIVPDQKDRGARPPRPNFRASLAYFNPNAPKTASTYNLIIPGLTDNAPPESNETPKDPTTATTRQVKIEEPPNDDIISFLLNSDRQKKLPTFGSADDTRTRARVDHSQTVPQSHQSLRELKRALPLAESSTNKSPRSFLESTKDLVGYCYNWRIEDGATLSYYLLDSKSRLHVVEGASESPKQPRNGSDPFQNGEKEEELYELENPSNYLPHYKDYFYTQAHTNLLGWDPKLGPVAVSVMKEKDTTLFNSSYWFLLRSQNGTEVGWIPEAKASTSRIARFPNPNQLELALKKTLKPHLKKAELHPVKGSDVCGALLELEKTFLVRAHKFGVIYSKAGQKGPEMFDNAEGDADFDEFLKLLGNKISLQEWRGYCGGLDIKKNKVLYDYTGRHSVFTQFKDLDIMFHVSTMLPHSVADNQSVRKEHIGGDVAVIVFQQGDEPFYPELIASPENQIFAVVRVDKTINDGKRHYRVAFTSREEVALHGPPLSENTVFNKGPVFKEFLLTKLVNAERAVYDSSPLADGVIQTRFILLSELVQRFLHPLKPSFEMKSYGQDTLPRKKKKLLKFDSTADLRKEKIEKKKKREEPKPRLKPKFKDVESVDLYSSVELEQEREFDDEASGPYIGEEPEEEDEEFFVVHTGSIYRDPRYTESEQTVVGANDEEDFYEARFVRKETSFATRDALYDDRQQAGKGREDIRRIIFAEGPDPGEEECESTNTAVTDRKVPKHKMIRHIAEVGRFSKRAMSLSKIDTNN